MIDKKTNLVAVYEQVQEYVHYNTALSNISHPSFFPSPFVFIRYQAVMEEVENLRQQLKLSEEELKRSRERYEQFFRFVFPYQHN